MSFPEEAVKRRNGPLTRLSDIWPFLYFWLKQVQKKSQESNLKCWIPGSVGGWSLTLLRKGEWRRLLRVSPDLWGFSRQKEDQWQNDVYTSLPTYPERQEVQACCPDSTVQSWWIYPEMNVTCPSACRSLPFVRMITNLWNIKFISIIPILLFTWKGGQGNSLWPVAHLIVSKFKPLWS